MSDQSSMIVGIGLCVIGIGGSAICSGLETGFYSINRIRLRLRAGDGNRRAELIHAELQQHDRLLTTLLIWNNVFNYLGSLGLTAILFGFGFSEAWVIALQALVLTPMLLIFAESIPKELFRVRADDLPFRLIHIVVVLRWICLPVLWVVLGFARWVAQLVGAGTAPGGDRRNRIASLLKEGVSHGAISRLQASLIDDAMDLARTPVGDLGVPFARLACVVEGAPHEQVQRAARSTGHEPVVFLDRVGRVASLVDPLDIGLGELPMDEPLRLEASLGSREALAEMAARGVRSAVLVRSGRDVGIVTTRHIVGPLLRSTRQPDRTARE